MIRTVLTSLFLLTLTGSAVEWGDYTEGELHWGERIRLDDYALEAADFTPEESRPWMVMLNLYEGEELIACRALEVGGSFSLDDRVQVSVEDIKIRDYTLDERIEPSAKVRIQVRAHPELVMRLSADDGSYDAGEYIELELNVENVGDVVAESIDIDVYSNPSLVTARFSKSDLLPGESWDEDDGTEKIDPLKVRVKAPDLPGPETFEVVANARYLDAEGDRLQSWGGTAFEVFGPLKLHKHLDEDQNFGDENHVHLTLRNIGNKVLVVKVTDSTGRDFRTSSALEWDLEIPPGDTKTVNYEAEAKKPGEGQVIPSAEAVYTLDGVSYKVISESPVVDVIGPFLEAKKRASADKVEVGEEVGLTIEVANVGNRRTKVSVVEPIPAWAKFLRGETELSRVLLPEEVATLEYVISCDEPGRFEVPPTKICYRDYDGVACMVDTSRLRIVVAGDIPEAANEADESFEAGENSEIGDIPAADPTASGPEDSNFAEEPPDKNLFVWVLAIVAILFVLFNRYM